VGSAESAAHLANNYLLLQGNRMEKKMKYIVTGCDGKLASRICNNVLKEVDGKDLIFTCPDIGRVLPENKQVWEDKGVSIRKADYDNKEEMIEAFRGGDRIYIVSALMNGPVRVVQHKNAFDAAVEAGVGHLVYTSYIGANDPDVHLYVQPDHTASEAYLYEMSSRIGFTYNVMRNNFYLENCLNTGVMLANIADYVWGTNAGDGLFTPIAKDDSAECAAALLLGRGGYNTVYDLTSEIPITMRYICELIAERSGKPYTYKVLDDDGFYAYLEALGIPKETQGFNYTAPVPWCGYDMITNEGGIRGGDLCVISHDVYKLLGRKPRFVDDILDEYSYLWEEDIRHWTQVR